MEHFRPWTKHGFEERRRPHAVSLVARDVDLLLECDQAIHHQSAPTGWISRAVRGKLVRYSQSPKSATGLGECKALRPERLLGELQTVQRKSSSMWKPLSNGTSRSKAASAISDHSGNAKQCSSFNRFTPGVQGCRVIQTSNGWQLESCGRAVINDRRSVLNRDDAGVREGLPVATSDEPAEGTIPRTTLPSPSRKMMSPRAEQLEYGSIPAAYLRVGLKWREIPGQSEARGSLPVPIISRPGGRFDPVGCFRKTRIVRREQQSSSR